MVQKRQIDTLLHQQPENRFLKRAETRF